MAAVRTFEMGATLHITYQVVGRGLMCIVIVHLIHCKVEY
jgi:hypothetical protein